MKKIIPAFVAITMACLTTKAQWSGNAEIADTKVCTANDTQRESHIVTDGSGGAIIFWWDNRGIYYNRLNNTGNAVWSSVADGLSLTNTNGFINQVISDGSGGAFISWGGYGNGNFCTAYQQYRCKSMAGYGCVIKFHRVV